MPDISGGGIALSIDLTGDGNGLVGYRGKHHTGVVDVDRRGAYDILDFWEPIVDRGERELILDPDEFYILVSREAVHVPPLFAAEMTPYRSSRRRVPRPLRRLLRSRFRPRRGRRPGKPRRA